MKITALKTFLVPPRWLFLKVETDEQVRPHAEAYRRIRSRAPDGRGCRRRPGRGIMAKEQPLEGMGAVITRSIPDFHLVVGNPASRAEPAETLGRMGYGCAEMDDPYAAMVHDAQLAKGSAARSNLQAAACGGLHHDVGARSIFHGVLNDVRQCPFQQRAALRRDVVEPARLDAEPARVEELEQPLPARGRARIAPKVVDDVAAAEHRELPPAPPHEYQTMT